MASYVLQYRTYDQLISEVQSDMKKFAVEDLIDPQDFIKVARKCNFELGLKLHKTKEKLIEIKNGRAKLPNDFYIFNYGFIVGSYSHCEPLISGTHTVNVQVGANYTPWPDDPNFCNPTLEPEPEPTSPCCGGCQQTYNRCGCIPITSPEVNCRGEQYVVVQKYEYYTRTWTEMYPVRLVNAGEFVDPHCLNKTINSQNTIEIKNGFIETSFKTGQIFISYQGQLIDEEGSILVPDHELLNEYYEYAVKDRVLENAIMNGETVTQLQLQLIKEGLRTSRNNSNSFINTPDYGELKRIWEVNRMAQYNKYFSMFKKF